MVSVETEEKRMETCILRLSLPISAEMAFAVGGLLQLLYLHAAMPSATTGKKRAKDFFDSGGGASVATLSST